MILYMLSCGGLGYILGEGCFGWGIVVVLLLLFWLGFCASFYLLVGLFAVRLLVILLGVFSYSGSEKSYLRTNTVNGVYQKPGLLPRVAIPRDAPPGQLIKFGKLGLVRPPFLCRFARTL